MRTQTKIALFFTSIVVLIFVVFGFVFHGYVHNDFQSRLRIKMLEDIVEENSLEKIRDMHEHVTIVDGGDHLFCQKGIFADMKDPSLYHNTFYRYNGDTYFIAQTKLGDGSTVCVADKVTMVAEQQNRWMQIYIGLSALFSVLTYFIGTMFGNAIMRPIQMINHYSSRYGTKGFESIPLPIKCQTGDDICRLVTTLNNLFERVSRESERLSRFSSDVAHEFKNALFEMRTEIELTQKKKNYQESLETIEKRLDSLNDLIESLLLLARIEGSEVPRKKTKLHDLIKGLPILHSENDDRPKISTKLEEVETKANKELLEIALTNLIGNAIKFTDKAKKITITLSTRSIQIHDQGIGIDPKKIDSIWDRFFKTSDCRAYGTGHGLGLAITREIIEHVHGWDIAVESEVKKGTTFTIDLR